jgi:tRNA pseudouridine55 synthase
MDGILVIDKPAGPTSHDVVQQVRTLLRQKKVGHTGTLDPVATGVLPLVIGRATKVARYLTGGDKTYVATVRLGVATDTLDSAGEVLEERPVEADESTVRETIAGFVGEIEQLPPMYSAKKVDGKRLYELARKGVEVERETKRVTVHRIDVKACNLPDVTIEVACSAGTYLRALALDIGEELG